MQDSGNKTCTLLQVKGAGKKQVSSLRPNWNGGMLEYWENGSWGTAILREWQNSS